MGCFSGCLMSSAGIQKLFCGIYSVFKCSFDEFVGAFDFYALEKEMATHSSVLTWRIPGTGEPGGLPSMGSHIVGHDWSDLAAAAATIFWVFSFALRVAPALCSCHSSTVQLVLQQLPSCWGFSALGCGVSPHSSHQKEWRDGAKAKTTPSCGCD